MLDFQLQQLNPIAFRVRDIHASVKWYREMLGLKQLRKKAWGEFPIIILTGSSDIALSQQRPIISKIYLMQMV